MSETAPLLPTSVRKNIPSRGQVESHLPSEQSRIHISECLGALKAGKIPSQEQVSRMIDLVLQSDSLKSTGGPSSRTARLGEEGARVLDDFKGVLTAFKAWGEEKNKDDLLQNLFYNAATADVDIDLNGPASKTSTSEMVKDSVAVVDSFRTIASLMVTSPAFRQLGSDVILMSRDILADGAELVADQAASAADATRPSEKERKDGVDYGKLKNKGKEHAKHTISGLYQAEAKEAAFDGAVSAVKYFDEKLPAADEAKDKLITRLQQIVLQAQKNKPYHQAIDTLVGIVKKYAHKAQDALDEAVEKSEVSDEDEKVQQAGRDLKKFVENLAGKSMDGVISTSQKAADDIKNDPRLTEYFNAIGEYLDRILHDEGYVVSQRAYRKASSLYDDGQSLLQDNEAWKSDASALQKELESFFNALTHDEATSNLVDAIETMGEDLADAGKVGFNSLKADGAGLYRDMVDVMLPRIIGLIKEIPVPRIEFKSEDVDLVIDDFNLDSASFIPDSIRFVAHNDFEFTQGYATYASEYDSTVRLRVKGLHVQASNIAYWVSKKSGWVQFEDSGLLDIQFGPRGIDFDVTLENATEDDRETFFVVKNVDVNIAGFDYQIRQNQKWFATWLAKAPMRAFLRSNIIHTLEVQITEYLQRADFQLFALQQRAIAATNARPTPANYLKAIFSSSVFPQGPGMLAGVRAGQKGIVKYGRRGEFVLHVGVDEDLFPGKPEGAAKNRKRDAIRGKVNAASNASGSVANRVKNDADKVKGEAEAEGRKLSRAAREQERREAKSEGWRSDVFTV
ncbi:hypothetical protein QFC22_001707 [Naganishia vaughanmartiniae]|uniref:Uncharacterized protein n=1 Tax=Naganishia vaughanmartiniae TaxID=1424756 RepID=A0ACC2XF74_9TREE|nr:hypothetical protein QFC22_001707 [Naganishia vaughanmartiniae]